MNVKTAIVIDHLIGTPLCWIMNFITRCVGMVLKRNHRPPFNVRRVLVIKMMGIGSIVQALPLLDGLKSTYPLAEIRMLCFPETEIFTRRVRMVSAVHTIDNGSLLKLAWTSLRELVKIIRWKPDLVLDLEYHAKFSTLLATMTCAMNRAGLFDATTRFRNYLNTHLLFANPRRHVADLYNQMGRIFGVQEFKPLEACAAAIVIGDRDRAELDRVLDEHRIGPGEKLILLNVNAGGLCLNRRWPARYFAELAAGLSDAGKVLLIGSPAERNYVESVRQQIGGQARDTVLNFAGSVSFGAYLELLRRAALVITNDTGPMHLAGVMGARVISLWGPGIAQTYEPRTPKHHALSADLFCSPCLYIAADCPCGDNNLCMKRLTPRMVAEAIHELAPEVAIDPQAIKGPERLNGEDWLMGLVTRP